MIFFDGQGYDAFELLVELVDEAEREIVLVDGYVNLGTLNILAKKREDVAATVWAKKKGDKLSGADIEMFRAQYGSFELKHAEAFHDRFLDENPSVRARNHGVWTLHSSCPCYKFCYKKSCSECFGV